MNTPRVLRGELIAAIVAWLVTASAFAAAPVIEATLAPRQIAIGESAQITIKRSGTDMQPPALPAVAGLEFRIVEQLHGIEFIHGVTVLTNTTVVRVTPRLAGTYVIPDLTPKGQPLLLRVNPANVGGVSSVLQPGPAGETAANGIRMTDDGAAFIRFTAARREVYVGESVPVAIELGMHAGVVTSVNGLPALTGSEFTLNNLSRQPERNERIIDGKPFIVLTWRSLLLPVKPGDFSLLVEAPVTIRVSTRPKREATLEDQLGDPFMQRIFGATVQKALKVASPQLELSVSALPTQGRPPEFSGAVGTFNISSDISPATAAAGDPLTLRMHVTGSGNFDRVDSNMLEHVENWKAYPPTSSFKPADALGFKGEKVFEQPVIASTSGPQTLPALTLAYFDPTLRRYETARTVPLGVAISPSPADRALSAREVSSGTAPATDSRGLLGLRPDRTAPGVRSSSLMPLYLRPKFLAIPSFLTLVFLGTWAQRRRRGDFSSPRSPRERDLSKATRRALAQMEEAARAGDSVRFFDLARRTLQQALAARWQMTPAQITAAEVDARLEAEGDGNEIRRLFALADEANYAGRGVGSADLPAWLQFVRRRALEEKVP